MVKSKYKVIGVMSGTSLDGIDIVYATFTKDVQWHFEIVYAETVSYTDHWEKKLRNLVLLSEADLKQTDTAYTHYLAGIIKQFIEKYKIQHIDAVCSHGHTALHQPEKKLTYQIGNLPILAHLLQQTVVCDFRVQDVALGGQGAPLVPIGDSLLFSEFDFCINLGGFANISTTTNNKRIAFDICPVNIVLNHYVKQIGLDFDDGGKMASSGAINKELLKQLNAIEFYKEPYPKSLGLEWVHTYVFPIIDAYDLAAKDILRTVIEHIAFQISKQINYKKKASLLITGGGVFNTFLIDRLKTYTDHPIIIPSKTIIEFKEALIFGFLGVLKLRGESNCLHSVTGASHDHSSGNIFSP